MTGEQTGNDTGWTSHKLHGKYFGNNMGIAMNNTGDHVEEWQKTTRFYFGVIIRFILCHYRGHLGVIIGGCLDVITGGVFGFCFDVIIKLVLVSS